MNEHIARRREWAGFSLIELLVVIAIIAVLMALLFPVVVSQRVKARRNACAANMEQIAGALRMYRLDNGAYPPALFGFVTPQNTVVSGLYPHWARNREDFVCPENPTLVNVNPRTAMAMPGDAGGINPTLTQPVPAPEMVQGRWTVGGKATPLYPQGIRFPVGDSYDVNYVPADRWPDYGVWERHYQRQWLPMLNLASANTDNLPLIGDTPKERFRSYARQLVFRRPDDETLVTDCTYHRNYPSGWKVGDPLPSDSFDVVLFLDGHTEVRPSQPLNVYQNLLGTTTWAGWQIKAR